MNVVRIITASLLILLLSAVTAFTGMDKVLARGQGVEVTDSDVKAMKRIAGGGGHPTAKALVEGTLRMELFAAEARREGLPCPAAEEKKGFDQVFALAQCYMEAKLAAMTVKDDAVESYYRVYWRRFIDKKNGELQELDDGLQEKIRERILAAKKKNFGLQEYSRLCKKYNVVFVRDGS